MKSYSPMKVALVGNVTEVVMGSGGLSGGGSYSSRSYSFSYGSGRQRN